MKKTIRAFGIITIIYAAMIMIVLKPYRIEIVDLDLFSDYYVETIKIVVTSSNVNMYDGLMSITPIEKRNDGSRVVSYKIDERDIEGVAEEEPRSDRVYDIPKKEIYVVETGDTIEKISKKYGIGVEILKANNPGITNKLAVGQKLNVLRTNGIFYKVKKGDSLYEIALDYKVTVDEIKLYNKIKDNNIRVGEEIFIYNPSDAALKILATAKTTTKESGKTADKSTTEKNTSQPNTRFSMPVTWAGITSKFGGRFHPVLKRYINHAGVDFRAKYVPLKATKSGIVTFAGYVSGYGNLIKIDHGNGYETRSAHLDKMYVKKGQHVSAGQVIGKTGKSGRVTGPHLHFEIRKDGKAYNPMNYIGK